MIAVYYLKETIYKTTTYKEKKKTAGGVSVRRITQRSFRVKIPLQ
jgi:hypothetical protein